MTRKIFGWVLVLAPAGLLAFGILSAAFQLLFDPRSVVASEVSTSLQIMAMLAGVALVPMGLGAALIAWGGGISPGLRKVTGWGLVIGPVLHLALLFISGLQYYGGAPAGVPADEFATSFLPSVGLTGLVAAIPIGVGIALVRNIDLTGRRPPPPSRGEPSRDDELLSA